MIRRKHQPDAEPESPDARETASAGVPARAGARETVPGSGAYGADTIATPPSFLAEGMEISGDLEKEVRGFAPDLDQLTHAKRLTYHIKSNWKNVVDNFLECYHCPTAHKDFVSLVDMDNYTVTTHRYYSAHIAPAGKSENTASGGSGPTSACCAIPAPAT